MNNTITPHKNIHIYLPAQLTHDIPDRIGNIPGDMIQAPAIIVDEPLAVSLLELRNQPGVEIESIEDDDGLVVEAELTERDDLRKFLDGPESAGETDEGVGTVLHDRLACPHAVDYDHLVHEPGGETHVPERGGDHADMPSTLPVHGLGEHAHEAVIAAAVDQFEVFPDESGAQFACDREVCVGDMIARRAEDADGGGAVTGSVVGSPDAAGGSGTAGTEDPAGANPNPCAHQRPGCRQVRRCWGVVGAEHTDHTDREPQNHGDRSQCSRA